MGFDGEGENQIATHTFDTAHDNFNAGDAIIIGYRRTAGDGDSSWTTGETYFDQVTVYFSGILVVNY